MGDWLSDLRSVYEGSRNGVVYGAKVRFMHSLVMAILFRSGSIGSRLNQVLRLTLSHAKSLGLFVGLYKALLIIFRRVFAENKWNSFVAGAICGFAVFRDQTAVNEQIVLYLTSRVITGAIAHCSRDLLHHLYPLQAALCWGSVMWLYTEDAAALQPGLAASMRYLYAP